jgi:hypothetical protein
VNCPIEWDRDMAYMPSIIPNSNEYLFLQFSVEQTSGTIAAIL